MKFSFLNFNTLGTPFFAPDINLRYKKIGEIISRENIDIICLQEIVTYYHLSLLKKYLTYPYFIYKKNIHGPKGGLVIISKIPLEQTTFYTFQTHGSLKNKSFFSKLVQNGILIAKVKNHDLAIANTHTVTDFEFDDSPTNHLYQYVKAHIEDVAKNIKLHAAKKQTIVLSGDFNNKKGSKLYNYFLDETKAIDVFKDDSFPTYHKERLNYKFNGKTSERIDFVFVINSQQKIKPLKKAYLFDKEETLFGGKKSYLSDHIGLKVNFDIV